MLGPYSKVTSLLGWRETNLASRLLSSVCPSCPTVRQLLLPFLIGLDTWSEHQTP